MSTSTTNPNILLAYIEKALKEHIEIEAKRLIKESQDILEQKMPEIVGRTISDVMLMVDQSEMANKVVFTIRKI